MNASPPIDSAGRQWIRFRSCHDKPQHVDWLRAAMSKRKLG
jgi:hypothetical protein